MKKEQIDFFASTATPFLLSKRWKHKFLRAWKTEYKDGVHVFKERTYLYYEGGLDSDDRASRNAVCKLLKIPRKDAEGNDLQYGGLHEAWIYLRKNRKPSMDFYDRDILALKINGFFTVEQKRTITIDIIDKNDPYKFNGWSKDQIWNYVDTQYDTVLDNSIVSSRGDTLLDHAIGNFVLLDNGTYFNIEPLRAFVQPVKKTRIEKSLSGQDIEIGYFETSLSIDLKISRKDTLTGSSNIVDAMMSTQDQDVMKYLQTLIDADHDRLVSEGLVDVSVIGDVTSPINKVPTPTYNSLWYKGQLRVAACTDATLLQSINFPKLIMATIDFDTTKQKSTKTQRWTGPILIIIAVVIAILTGGSGWALVKAVALWVGGTAVVLTVMSMIMANQGKAAGAKVMGKWAMVASVISIVANIASIIQGISRAGVQAAGASAVSGGSQAAQNLAYDAAVSQATTNAAVGAGSGAAVGAGLSYGLTGKIDPMTTVAGAAGGLSIADSATSQGLSITDSVIKSLETSFELSFKSIKSYVSSAFKVIGKYMSWQANREADELKTITQEYDDRQRILDEQNMLLGDREMNLGLDYIEAGTKLLTIQNAQYEVDWLYEGTKFNICRPSFYNATGLNIISNDIADYRL